MQSPESTDIRVGEATSLASQSGDDPVPEWTIADASNVRQAAAAGDRGSWTALMTGAGEAE